MGQAPVRLPHHIASDGDYSDCVRIHGLAINHDCLLQVVCLEAALVPKKTILGHGNLKPAQF